MTTMDQVAVITDIHANLPALQAALARIVLRERVQPVQELGVGLALAGIVLISAG